MVKKIEEPFQKEHFFNEHDESQTDNLLKTITRKKLKKNVKRGLIIGFFVLIFLFFISPLSRVRYIHTEGLEFLTEEAVIEASGVHPDSIHLFVSKSKIEKQLLNEGMIAKCQVKKGFFSTVTIIIEEKKVIAYQQNNNDLLLVDENGGTFTTSVKKLKGVQTLISLGNFEEVETIDKFTKELAKVPTTVQTLISEAIFSPVEAYDMTRVQLIMSDGKTVFVRYEDMASQLKYYQEILSKEPNACIYDIDGNKAYITQCPSATDE